MIYGSKRTGRILMIVLLIVFILGFFSLIRFFPTGPGFPELGGMSMTMFNRENISIKSSLWRLYQGCYEIVRIQKFRRMVSYAGFFGFTALISYAYTNNTTRAGLSRADQFYASYPAGTELLTDSTKLYKVALGNCFEIEEWGPVEWCILAKHFERQGKSPYAYHAQYMAHLASHGQLDGSG